MHLNIFVYSKFYVKRLNKNLGQLIKLRTLRFSLWNVRHSSKLLIFELQNVYKNVQYS